MVRRERTGLVGSLRCEGVIFFKFLDLKYLIYSVDLRKIKLVNLRFEFNKLLSIKRVFQSNYFLQNFFCIFQSI